jgi:hypothetical protein
MHLLGCTPIGTKKLYFQILDEKNTNNIKNFRFNCQLVLALANENHTYMSEVFTEIHLLKNCLKLTSISSSFFR